jgi:hypothetical protein
VKTIIVGQQMPSLEILPIINVIHDTTTPPGFILEEENLQVQQWLSVLQLSFLTKLFNDKVIFSDFH